MLKKQWEEDDKPLASKYILDCFKDLKGSEAKVFMCLWSYMDYCNPFINITEDLKKDISQKIGYAVSTVNRGIKTLLKIGALKKDGQDVYIEPNLIYPGYPEDVEEFVNSRLSPREYLFFRKSNPLNLSDK